VKEAENLESPFAKMRCIFLYQDQLYAVIQPYNYASKTWDNRVNCPCVQRTNQFKVIPIEPEETIQGRVQIVQDPTPNNVDNNHWVNIWITIGKYRFPENLRDQFLEECIYTNHNINK
jgi:hypothetical protein